jgi:hypothetical protein
MRWAFVLLLMVTVQGGVDAVVIERVCLPADMKRNTWVVIEYDPAGRNIEGDVMYVVPNSGYGKVPFQSPSVSTKVLLKVGDSQFVDAHRSQDVHALRRQTRIVATTEKKTTRDFMIFFYGDERGVVDAWSDHIPK